jgi:hypothetical protein
MFFPISPTPPRAKMRTECFDFAKTCNLLYLVVHYTQKNRPKSLSIIITERKSGTQEKRTKRLYPCHDAKKAARPALSPPSGQLFGCSRQFIAAANAQTLFPRR